VNIVVQEDLKTYIDPLTQDEYDALERSLLAEGCRDALVLWGDILVDGHNRYGLCQKHGLAFNTVQNTRFKTLEDVHLWMIDQHLGRRSVSDFQRGVLALRKKEIVTERQAAAKAAAKDAHMRAEVLGEAEPVGPIDGTPAVAAEPPLKSREAVAKAARLTAGQVTMIEKIQKQAAPELVAAVRAGTISLNAAAAVADLPVEEQVAAASAGKDELKQAAKRARDANRKPPREEGGDAGSAQVQALQDRVAELTAENEYLRGQVAELQARLAG
jgi:polyhydroxyalkanoate synthesis regulator phasin